MKRPIEDLGLLNFFHGKVGLTILNNEMRIFLIIPLPSEWGSLYQFQKVLKIS